jgi:hypothetical protein
LLLKIEFLGRTASGVKNGAQSKGPVVPSGSVSGSNEKEEIISDYNKITEVNKSLLDNSDSQDKVLLVTLFLLL